MEAIRVSRGVMEVEMTQRMGRVGDDTCIFPVKMKFVHNVVGIIYAL